MKIELTSYNVAYNAYYETATLELLEAEKSGDLDWLIVDAHKRLDDEYRNRIDWSRYDFNEAVAQLKRMVGFDIKHALA